MVGKFLRNSRAGLPDGRQKKRHDLVDEWLSRGHSVGVSGGCRGKADAEIITATLPQLLADLRELATCSVAWADLFRDDGRCLASVGWATVDGAGYRGRRNTIRITELGLDLYYATVGLDRKREAV